MATASAPSAETRSKPPTRCGAKARGGGTCSLSAGWGTDHVGYGSCKYHGGCVRNGRKHAYKLMALDLAGDLQIAPEDALLWMVRREARAVFVYSQAAAHAAREEDEPEEKIAELVRLADAAGERLVRYSKAALDAGVAERAVRVAEQFGELLAQRLGLIFDELELTPEQQQRAPDIVHRNLLALEAAEVAA